MSDYLLAAPIPPDGRLQVWNFDSSNVLQTRWKMTSDPNSQWTTPWFPFSPPPPLPFFDMTAGVLPDGRTQIWGVGYDPVPNILKVYTTWKITTAHDSFWTNWNQFDTTPLGGIGAIGIAVAALNDKRLQLFIMDVNSNIWTAWKRTTDPNSPWTSLTLFK